MRLQTSTLLVSILALSLASCASVPQQDQLLSGIDATKLAQSPSTKLSPTDATCVDFYNNVTAFQKQAQKSKGGQNFMAALGLNVIASVATAGLIPAAGIGSTVGRVAAYSAASSVTSQGSRIALRELNSSDRADAKIIEVADQIGCPVVVSP